MSSPASSPSPLDARPSTPPSDDEVLVRVEGVSKKFCRSLKKSLWYGVCDIAGELLPFGKRQRVAGSELLVAGEEAEVAGSELLVASGNASAEGGDRAAGASGLVTRHQSPVTPEASLREGEFFAVKDVSFELRRGECLGLIGHNGAGKTTLLKMLNGLIKPDAGSITMRGRVGALIALGAGFNPILTGRENIYINGSVLGLTKKEIDAKIDEIIDFAEIREAIDMPVQNYSSGMAVRLGFAIATTLNPDILILDEVLAVGDVRFRAKCYHRIGQVLKKAAVIYVAHDMNQVGRICNEVIVMSRGTKIYLGKPAKGIEIYMRKNALKNDINSAGCETWGGDLQIHSIRVEPQKIVSGNTVRIIVDYTSENIHSVGSLRCNFVNENKLLVADYDSGIHGHEYEFLKGRHSLEIPLGRLLLSRGDYQLNLAAFDKSCKVSLFHAYDQPGVEVTSNMITTSITEMGHI
jgi:lipopolysaccharide transport system ATP-binding protein